MFKLKEIECPFCEDAKVKMRHRPPVRKKNLTSTVAGRKSTSMSTSAEVNQVMEDCPNCGAKKKDIEKKIEDPAEKPSSEKVLERLRDAGLPTTLSSKKKKKK